MSTGHTLRLATLADLDSLLPLVRGYHAFERIDMDAAACTAALRPLLDAGDIGRVWLVEIDAQVVGYAAVCFGYSIEFGGRDAFLDEFFLIDAVRGRGIGRAVLERVCTAVRAHGVRGLHLEVARDNERARALYRTLGFEARERFMLMSREVDPE